MAPAFAEDPWPIKASKAKIAFKAMIERGLGASGFRVLGLVMGYGLEVGVPWGLGFWLPK